MWILIDNLSALCDSLMYNGSRNFSHHIVSLATHSCRSTSAPVDEPNNCLNMNAAVWSAMTRKCRMILSIWVRRELKKVGWQQSLTSCARAGLVDPSTYAQRELRPETNRDCSSIHLAFFWDPAKPGPADVTMLVDSVKHNVDIISSRQ